jgi:hypothetical protein
MASETVTLITAIVGAVCGVAGTILGVINIWHQLTRNKVRLKVTPQHTILMLNRSMPLNFSIEVVNLSEFPVVIEDIGFQLADGRKATISPVPGLEPNGSLPMRLESRAAYSKIFSLDQNLVPWSKVRCAYARTQCGTLVTGTSPALQQLVRKGGCL